LRPAPRKEAEDAGRAAELVSLPSRTYLPLRASLARPSELDALQDRSPHRPAPKAARGAARRSALPSREELIAFIAGAPAPNEKRAPARVTKRDIAHAFDVKGEAKTELKLLIKDLQAEGAVARGRKALTVEGRLPSLVVADIAERDRDGELIARPVEWSGDAPAPRILVRRSRAKRGRAAT